MACHKGKEGVVKIGTAPGTNSVVELEGWTLDEQCAVVDTSGYDDDWDTCEAGTKSATGTITAKADQSDTTGQGALTVGAAVTLNLYEETAASGKKYFTCAAIVTGRATAVAGRNDVSKRSWTWKANGAVTTGTVTP